MKYILAKWADNWADEMDLAGFKIFTEKEWQDYEAKVSGITDAFTFSVGTNEEIDYQNGKELLKNISIEKISTNKVDSLTNLFLKHPKGYNSYYGFFPTQNHLPIYK